MRSLILFSGLMIGCATASGVQATTSKSDSIRIQISVPETKIIPRRGASCGSAADATELVDILADLTKDTPFGELTASIADSDYLRNRIRVLTRVRGGEMKCRYSCALLPSVPSRTTACVDGSEGNYCKSIAGDKFLYYVFDYWASIEEVSWTPVDGGYTSCLLAKNWKHDWARNFTVTYEFQ